MLRGHATDCSMDRTGYSYVLSKLLQFARCARSFCNRLGEKCWDDGGPIDRSSHECCGALIFSNSHTSAVLRLHSEVQPNRLRRQQFGEFIAPLCDDHSALIQQFIPAQCE